MSASDAELVKRSWAGDQTAFGELASRHRATVERIAHGFTRDPEQARDLAQETLIRAYSRLGQLREPERFGPWIMAIARSVCVNWSQAEAVRRRLADGSAFPVPILPETPDQQVQQRERDAEVRRLISGLPDSQRDAIDRYYFRGQSHAQIADELGVAVGTIRARVHHARRTLMEEVRDVSRQWYGDCECPDRASDTMVLEELARRAVERYDLGTYEALGPVYEPSDSIAVGVQTTKGRHRLWRHHGFMNPELVELQHAMLRHLDGKGVPVKRLIPTRGGDTWVQVDRQLVTMFEWFGGEQPSLRNRGDLTGVAQLHGAWTRALEDFDPPIDNWRELASKWRPRKGWAWVLPTEDLPRVPERMGFFAAVRDVENPPAHHERMLRQVREIETLLQELAELTEELDLAALPRGLNHGVFLFGLRDWDLTVTDAEDFVHEARIADLARLLFAIHDRRMIDYEQRDRAALAVEAYREIVDLSAQELQALPVLAWGMQLYYDAFHVPLYLAELAGPDMGEHLVAEGLGPWLAERKRLRDTLLGLRASLA